MESVKRFLSTANTTDTGAGDGLGDGSGIDFGKGNGSGFIPGSGSGHSYIIFSGYGNGDSCTAGHDRCFGYGRGASTTADSPNTDAAGYGHGFGDVAHFCGHDVYDIDGMPTLIYQVHGNVARGAILRHDLTLKPCYIIKRDNMFAHGETLYEASRALDDKIFRGLSVDERMDEFILKHPHINKPYPCKDLDQWHHRLTGSCDMGRKSFAAACGIDIEHDSITVRQFLKLTRNEYGGKVIRLLERRLRDK